MTAHVNLTGREVALASVQRSLRLSPSATFKQLTAQALRRAAGLLAPCPRHVLERAVEESLQHLAEPQLDLRETITATLEDLIIYGDILEMHPLANDEWEAATSLILRPSPPCFVRHHSGAAILVGVAGDEIVPLANEINERVRFHETLRVLDPREGAEDIATLLTQGGLPELASAAWLRMPPVETLRNYLSKWSDRLRRSPRPADIEGLVIFGGTGNDFYPARRTPPSAGHTGMFVGRRSQRFGADLWCLVDIMEGTPAHLIDLVSEGDRLRPCDVAWRILMASDAEKAQPQRARIRRVADSIRLDFFAPVPAWAQRYIAVDGDIAEPNHCLLSYQVRPDAMDMVSKMLTERLWLKLYEEPQDGGTS